MNRICFLVFGLLSCTVFLASCKNASAYDVSMLDEGGYAVSWNEIQIHTTASSTGMSLHEAEILRGTRFFSVPVLMYHYIRPMPSEKDKLGKGLTVTPQTFGAQLDILQKKGYHTISFSELADTGAMLPPKPIILTFDDGYQDAYDAVFPALVMRHMVGTFYIVSGFVGKPNYATRQELIDMNAAGMEMGAHTVNHLDLRKLSSAQQTHEIEDSIKVIDDALHTHVVSLAYPSGRYNADTLKIAKAAGLSFAVTTHPGVANSAQNLLELTRIRVTEKTDFEKLF